MFLEPMVVQANDPSKHNGEYNILVEPMLEGKYTKFNDNMGMVRGQSRSVSVDELSTSFGDLGLTGGQLSGALGFDLGAIEEEEEEEEESDNDIVGDEKSMPRMEGNYNLSKVQREHTPQAFSHFTYANSKKRCMVVDLLLICRLDRPSTSLFTPNATSPPPRAVVGRKSGEGESCVAVNSDP